MRPTSGVYQTRKSMWSPLYWTLPSLRDQNPLTWMAEVNGLLVDLRQMPREVQEIAFEKGMIPYIPVERE